MQQSVETERLPDNSKAWLTAIVITGLTIAMAAGWSAYLYGNILNKLMGWQAFRFTLVGVLLFAFVTTLLRGLVALLFRWNGKEFPSFVPGNWTAVWMSFKLACLLAVLALGAAVLLALAFGHGERMLQGFMLVLVISGLLFLAGGVVQETSRLVRIARH